MTVETREPADVGRNRRVVGGREAQARQIEAAAGPTAPGSLGQSVASFLLGLPSGGAVVRAASYDEQSTTWGFYVQDDWRLGSRLTLNLGLRYEVETPLTEKDNASVRGFDAAAAQPMEAAVRAAYAQNPVAEIPVSQFNVRGGLRSPA